MLKSEQLKSEWHKSGRREREWHKKNNTKVNNTKMNTFDTRRRLSSPMTVERDTRIRDTLPTSCHSTKLDVTSGKSSGLWTITYEGANRYGKRWVESQNPFYRWILSHQKKTSEVDCVPSKRKNTFSELGPAKNNSWIESHNNDLWVNSWILYDW